MSDDEGGMEDLEVENEDEGDFEVETDVHIPTAAVPEEDVSMADAGDVSWPASLAPNATAVSELLSTEDTDGKATIPRAASDAAVYDDRFMLKSKEFTKQYASIYFCRLALLRPHVQKELEAGWAAKSKAEICKKISTIVPNKPTMVIGTIYKDMKLKPSILEEYAKQSGAPAPLRPSYVSDDDFLVMEDETGRITLNLSHIKNPDIKVANLVSGVVVAVRGREVTGGDFMVEDMCFPAPAPQPPLPNSDGPDRYVVFLSGLQVGHPSTDPLAMQLMLDYLSGFLGNSTEQQFCSQIVRVVIAGESLYEQPVEEEASFKKRRQQRGRLLSPLKELDLVLSQLAASVQVDILPGASDPANVSLPQQPLHNCLFPSASKFATFSRVTNPAKFNAHGLSFLGTSGQPTQDLSRYSTAAHPIALLERTLRWRNLAPTAPDTLACYPYQDADPFIIGETPHIYFAGNQKAFSTKLVKGPQGAITRLLMIPSFYTTQTIVFVNTKNLECHTMQFTPPQLSLPTDSAAAKS